MSRAHAFKGMAHLTRHVVSRATSDLPPDVGARVATLAAAFDRAVSGLPSVRLNIVVFHLKLPEEHRHINYVDIKADQGLIDFVPVLQHCFGMARAHHPDCRIIFVTGAQDDISFVPSDVVVVRLPLDASRLMYERAVATTAFMNSAAFAANTVFLDGDAFANAPLDRVFRLHFDVAVTFRQDPKFMPLNEGVIFAACNPGMGARRFFQRYLATYEALCRDEDIIDLYKDIRRWRGGQLSLCAAAAATGLISEIDQRMIAGALVRYLDCDDYNFFVKGESYPAPLLERKYVLHMKGPDKTRVAALAALQKQWLAGQRTDGVLAPAAPALPTFVAPAFSLINKEYGKPPYSDPEVRQRFVGHVQGAMEIMRANKPGSGAVGVDDMLLWFRNIGFLEQPDFIEAFLPYINDSILRARIWRVYMLCWGARSCLRLPGDFMDIGCYDGHTVDVMARYCKFEQIQDKTWWLYDMFENPPPEARKGSHGPQLFDKVRHEFERRGRFRVIKGPVPDSFGQGLPDKVAFAQIDLNAAEPEIGTLEVIYDRIVPGGMIIFDDYGFVRHRPSYEAELAWFARRGEIVWESPTGQGLFIKR